jgi:hypothetical protein
MISSPLLEGGRYEFRMNITSTEVARSRGLEWVETVNRGSKTHPGLYAHRVLRTLLGIRKF